jgi:hypothetical protein
MTVTMNRQMSNPIYFLTIQTLAVVDVIRRTSFKYSKAGLVAFHVVGDLVHELCIEICRRGAFQRVSLTFDMS